MNKPKRTFRRYTSFDVSPKGVKSSNDILDWNTGEIIVAASKRVLPTVELSDRVKKSIADAPNPDDKTLEAWAVRYIRDLDFYEGILSEYLFFGPDYFLFDNEAWESSVITPGLYLKKRDGGLLYP